MTVLPLREDEVPEYTHIVADSDMDGLFGAAVLKAFRPEATVMFSHAAALRGGLVDDHIDRNTVLVDLPFHSACGWYVDHPTERGLPRLRQTVEHSIGKPRPPPPDWRTTF